MRTCEHCGNEYGKRRSEAYWQYEERRPCADKGRRTTRVPDAEFKARGRTDVPDLLAEVERLRSGIEALAESFEEDVDWSSGRGDYGDNAAYEACARRARALLNPNEGDDRD